MTFPRRVVIAHGYNAHPDKHWFPWLASEVEVGGGEAVRIPFPDAAEPTVEKWGAATAKAVGQVDARTWLVGHSLGCVTLLRHLASLDEPWQLGGIVLVAGFDGPLASLPQLDEYLAETLDDEQIARIVANTGVIRTIRSDDDIAVPPASSDELARRLESEVAVVPGGGHFGEVDGWVELPIVLTAFTAEATPDARLAP